MSTIAALLPTLQLQPARSTFYPRVQKRKIMGNKAMLVILCRFTAVMVNMHLAAVAPMPQPPALGGFMSALHSFLLPQICLFVFYFFLLFFCLIQFRSAQKMFRNPKQLPYSPFVALFMMLIAHGPILFLLVYYLVRTSESNIGHTT